MNDIVLDIVSEIIVTNDPGQAAKAISIALLSLANGSSKDAHEALDYACEQVFDVL